MQKSFKETSIVNDKADNTEEQKSNSMKFFGGFETV